MIMWVFPRHKVDLVFHAALGVSALSIKLQGGGW
jgi:hypothetical protein